MGMMRMMVLLVRKVTVWQRIQRITALADLEQYGGHNDGLQDLEDDAEEKIPSEKQRNRETEKETKNEREKERKNERARVRDRDMCRDRSDETNDVISIHGRGI